jgi:transposase
LFAAGFTHILLQAAVILQPRFAVFQDLFTLTLWTIRLNSILYKNSSSHSLADQCQQVKQMGKRVSRLHTIGADGGFDGAAFMMWVMDICGWILQVVLRPQQTKGFVLLKKRWVVERTLGWLMRCRRLVRDYERFPETSATFIYLAMIRIMVRRLA